MVSFCQYLDKKYYLYYKNHLNCNYKKNNRRLIDIIKKYLLLTDNNRYGIKKKKRRRKIIVSLTSIPERMDSLYYTLISIFNQTIKPDYIFLYLAKDEFENKNILPERIKKLQCRGLKIKYVDNLKSHKKYYYTMRQFPNDLMITLDDDIIYSEKLIQHLLEEYERHPECVVCSRSRIIKRIKGEIIRYNSWKCIDEYENTEKINQDDIFFTTGGGTLFPNWMYIEETLNKENILRYAPLADDVWLNYMTRLSGIKIYNTTSTDCHCLFNCEEQKFALADYNMGNNGNDYCISNMYLKYNIKL